MSVEEFKPRPSLEELAQSHRAAISAALVHVVVAMEAARADGFFTEFNCGQDAFGIYRVGVVQMVRRY